MSIGDAIVMAGVEGRSLVHRLLPSRVASAFEAANAIAHPWYRCQALSEIGETVADPAQALAILERALAAAHELDEPNRIVSVASWPLRVLVARNIGDPSAEVDELLDVISGEPHSLRRADALFVLLGRVFPREELRHRVLDALIASLSLSRGWRSERLWAFTVSLIDRESTEAAAKIFLLMPECKAKRQLRNSSPRLRSLLLQI